jgi:hypothetical protein
MMDPFFLFFLRFYLLSSYFSLLYFKFSCICWFVPPSSHPTCDGGFLHTVSFLSVFSLLERKFFLKKETGVFVWCFFFFSYFLSFFVVFCLPPHLLNFGGTAGGRGGEGEGRGWVIFGEEGSRSKEPKMRIVYHIQSPVLCNKLSALLSFPLVRCCACSQPTGGVGWG